ncbi:MAG: hypothetical protein D6738_00025, partial [Acidobacteria bacterium]
RRADQELWTDPAIVAALAEGFVAVRERADLRPDLMRRYPAEGWPAMTILLPDGSPMFLVDDQGRAVRRLTSGFRPAEQIAGWLRASRALWRARRDAVIEAARERVENMARTAVPAAGTADPLFVWNQARALNATWDDDARYFGGPPRLPRFGAIELLLTLSGEGEPAFRPRALAATETLAQRLVDPETGGLYRMALGADWSRPQRELLLDRNARWLEVLARAYRSTGRRVLRERGMAVIRLLDERFGRPDGAFIQALCPECPDGRDETVIAADVALAGAALVRAGAAFGDRAAVDRGLAALEFVAARRFRPGRGIAREIEDGRPVLETDLEDLSAGLWGFVAACEATGLPAWRQRAEALARLTLDRLHDTATGALLDVAPRPSGPPPLRVGLFPARANARAARALVRLSEITGRDAYRKAARRIVDAFAGNPARLHLWTADVALAAHDLVFDREEALVVGDPRDDRARALALAAMGAEAPRSVVRWVDPERPERAGLGVEFAGRGPLLVARYRGHVSRQVRDPREVRGALAWLIETVEREAAEAARRKGDGDE